MRPALTRLILHYKSTTSFGIQLSKINNLFFVGCIACPRPAMARKKVALQYIPNNSTHHATFKNLSQGLMKNPREVTTLFGVNAYSVVHGEGESVSRVFPSHDEEVASLNQVQDHDDIYVTTFISHNPIY